MIEARSITKSYGRTLANNRLSLLIQPGEVLGLLGENGAGKSTFLSILAGMVQPDSGSLYVDGRPAAFASPKDALRAGVSIVYQHFSLIPTFTVREQMRLAGWSSSQLPDMLRARFTGSEKISEISLGERQLVEIAKSLITRPQVLLLDEPTSILTSAEADHLFTLARDLRNQGTSVVFVTHKLHEAMELCDRIVVLRQGMALGSLERQNGDWPSDAESQLLGDMFGRDRGAIEAETKSLPLDRSRDHIVGQGRPGLLTHFQVQDVSTEASPGQRALKEISLDLHPGEICAIVGVDGQGQRELADVCGGYKTGTGRVLLEGKTLPFGDAPAFLHAGIAYITDDRVSEGTVTGFSIEDNLILKRQRSWPVSRRGLLRRHSIRKHADDLIGRWHIEPADAEMLIGSLSGGNMQKVILARELLMAISLLIANKPTQGLDVRTQRHVWSEIKGFTSGDGSVLLLTTDIDEALTHADRIGVMYDGRVSSIQPVRSGIRPELERMMVAGWE